MTLIPSKVVLVYLCKRLLTLYTVIQFNVVYLDQQSLIKLNTLVKKHFTQEVMWRNMISKIFNLNSTRLILIV